MHNKTPRFTADFLITDAKVRLAFERARKNQVAPTIQESRIDFLPLAAAGKAVDKKVCYFSQDHNFVVTFSRSSSSCVCDIQAQGYAIIQSVQNRSVQICFDKQFYYLACFDEKGFSRSVLPLQSPSKKDWSTLALTLKI